MGAVTEELIVTLNGGGAAARDCLIYVGELLRKAWHQGFQPVRLKSASKLIRVVGPT